MLDNQSMECYIAPDMKADFGQIFEMLGKNRSTDRCVLARIPNHLPAGPP